MRAVQAHLAALAMRQAPLTVLMGPANAQTAPERRKRCAHAARVAQGRCQMHIEQTQVQIERVEQAMETERSARPQGSVRRCAARPRKPSMKSRSTTKKAR